MNFIYIYTDNGIRRSIKRQGMEVACVGIIYALRHGLIFVIHSEESISENGKMHRIRIILLAISGIQNLNSFAQEHASVRVVDN